MKVGSKNAAVLIYNIKNMPGILGIFTSPEIKERHVITFGEQSYNLYIIEYPVTSDDFNNKRKNKVLAKLKNDHKIEFAAVRVSEDIHHGMHRANQARKEIEAIKAYAALNKYSAMTNRNVFKGCFGFLMKDISMDVIDALSDEASNIMIYESNQMDSKVKSMVYSEFMNNKGISIVFSKNISKIIKNSDTLVVDESVDLESYAEDIKYKLIYGKNPFEDCKVRIEDVHLSVNPTEDFSTQNIYLFLKDEILMMLRYFNKDMPTQEFVSMFEYTYMYNAKNAWKALSFCV